MIREFNVNVVARVLERNFKLKDVLIEEVLVASAGNNPIRKRVGIGGVLTIICEVEEKKQKRDKK